LVTEGPEMEGGAKALKRAAGENGETAGGKSGAGGGEKKAVLGQRSGKGCTRIW